MPRDTRNKNENLDSFYGHRGPHSMVIEAVSPDKTASTITQSPSPTSVATELFRQHQHQVSYGQQQQEDGRDNLICIEVESSSATSIFYISTSNMVKREMEMRETAKKTNVTREQWSSSRIYSMWKRARSQKGGVGGQQEQQQQNVSITLRLTPEEAMKDFSCFEWRPWLTTCIRDFYNTGSIRIQDQCLGSDLLLALEYLRIITTSPEIFVFNSFHPYERIKSWSAYFTKRRMVVDWVIQNYKKMGGGILMYTTTPYSDEAMVTGKQHQWGGVALHVKGQPVSVMGGSTTTKSSSGSSSSSSHSIHRIIHELFCDIQSENHLTKEVPTRIRHDFRDQLLRFLPPQTRISFELHRVTVTKSSGVQVQVRPVLRIEGVKLVVMKDEKKKKTPAASPVKIKKRMDTTSSPPPPPRGRKPPPPSTGPTSSSPAQNHHSNELPLKNIRVPSPTKQGQERNNSYLANVGQTVDEEYINFHVAQQLQQGHKNTTAKPVAVVDTWNGGDTTSVTSGLSYSMIDETTVGTIESTLDQMGQKAVAESSRQKEKQRRQKDTNKRSSSRRRGSIRSEKESVASEYESFRSFERRRYRDGNNNVCESVETFLISMCDQMIAATPEHDNRSQSPIREICIPLGTDQDTFHSKMTTDDGYGRRNNNADPNALPVTKAVEMIFENTQNCSNEIEPAFAACGVQDDQGRAGTSSDFATDALASAQSFGANLYKQMDGMVSEYFDSQETNNGPLKPKTNTIATTNNSASQGSKEGLHITKSQGQEKKLSKKTSLLDAAAGYENTV